MMAHAIKLKQSAAAAIEEAQSTHDSEEFEEGQMSENEHVHMDDQMEDIRNVPPPPPPPRLQ